MGHDLASIESFLEAIATLTDSKDYAQTTEVARVLGVKMPSVTAAFEQIGGSLRNAARYRVEGEKHRSTQLISGLAVTYEF